MAKLGVVGVGRMGRCHAENLRSRIPEANLIAVADVDLEAARRLAAELEIEHSYGSIEELVERKDIDVVVIASRSRFHLSNVQTAAVAGRHILCEKPLALTIDVVDDAQLSGRVAIPAVCWSRKRLARKLCSPLRSAFEFGWRI